MTATMNSYAWEISPAHEQHYHERKEHVVALLLEWGSRTNTQWPETARFISISEITIGPEHFAMIVMIGKASIARSIIGLKLRTLFPTHAWREGYHDVYFMEQTLGNVNKGVRPRTLVAYIVGPDYVRIVELGCHHPNTTSRKAGRCYREHQCIDCGYTWGVDSSD